MRRMSEEREIMDKVSAALARHDERLAATVSALEKMDIMYDVLTMQAEMLSTTIEALEKMVARVEKQHEMILEAYRIK